MVRVELRFPSYSRTVNETGYTDMPAVPEIGSSLLWDDVRFRVESVMWAKVNSEWVAQVILTEGVRVRTSGW